MDEIHDLEGKRFRQATVALFTILDVIVEMLGRLPDPIILPHHGEDHHAVEVLGDLDMARVIIRETELPQAAKNALLEVLLDWITAYEMGGIIRVAGMVSWRIDAMEAAVNRAADGFSVISAELPHLVFLDDEDQGTED